MSSQNLGSRLKTLLERELLCSGMLAQTVHPSTMAGNDPGIVVEQMGVVPTQRRDVVAKETVGTDLPLLLLGQVVDALHLGFGAPF